MEDSVMGDYKLTKEDLEDISYYMGYLPLWEEWAKQNPQLMEELKLASEGKVLTDPRVSQARALTDILSIPSVVEQLVSHMQNNGIAVYNKEEFDAFLEKNSDSIQALFNNAKKETLNGIPTIQIKYEKEYSIFLGDAYQHQERVIDDIGYANTYYNFYIYDLDEEGFPTPKYKIPINERNKRLIRGITRGKRLSKKDRALADSLLLTEIQSTTKGSVLPHFLELSTSNGAIQDMASETVEHRTERERLNLSNVNATSNTDSEAYRRTTGILSDTDLLAVITGVLYSDQVPEEIKDFLRT